MHGRKKKSLYFSNLAKRRLEVASVCNNSLDIFLKWYLEKTERRDYGKLNSRFWFQFFDAELSSKYLLSFSGKQFTFKSSEWQMGNLLCSGDNCVLFIDR